MSAQVALGALEKEGVAMLGARAHPDEIIGLMKTKGLSPAMTSIMLTKWASVTR